jgi:hypothetical protein
MAVSLASAGSSQKKSFSESLFLFMDLSKKNLSRTETELLFDSAIEQALNESSLMLDFNPESIKERIYLNLNEEINGLNEREYFFCSIPPKEEFFKNSVVLVELFESSYLIEFTYFGEGVFCSITSFNSEMTALLPKGYTSIKGGFLLAGN